MKKLTFALSIACAGALAFADTEQWNSDAWINGIGSGATSATSLSPTGGAWSGLSADNAELTSAKALELDLDTTEEALFTVSATTTEKTAQKLTITGVFTPLAAADLPAGTDMGQSGKKAQFGFAVVSTTATTAATETDEASTTTTYAYYAWVGEKDGSAAIDDWTKIGDCSDPEASTTLTIEASYWAGAPKATFTIGTTTKAFELTGDAATAANAANKVASIACTGSGTLSALNGVTGVAVASVGDTVYPTVDAAIAAAKDQTDATVKMEADPSGDVTIPADSTAKIDANGKSATIANNGAMDVAVNTSGSGTVEIPMNISGSGTVNYKLNDTSKEIVGTPTVSDGKVSVTVQTAKSILEGVKFADVAPTTKNETKFRTFLTDEGITAYTEANATAEKIQAALNENGGNELKKWQSYALGIASSTTLATDYVTDSATDAITLKLAPSTGAIDATGDYTITYKVGEQTATDPAAIKVPLATGRYPVKIVFTAPTND